MIKKISCKLFLTLFVFICVSSDIYPLEHEKVIRENFLLSDKLLSSTEKLKQKEKAYVDTIKNLKIKYYLLSKKNNKNSKSYKLRSDFFEEKIKEWKDLLNFLENIKNELPFFLRQEFINKKENLLNVFEKNISFELKADAFKNFLENEINKSLNPYFKEGDFSINNKIQSGKALIYENNTVLVKVKKNYYLWDKRKKEYILIKNTGFDEIFSKPDKNRDYFKPFFIEPENENN